MTTETKKSTNFLIVLVFLCAVGLITSHEWTFAVEKSEAKSLIESAETLKDQEEQKNEQKEEKAVRLDKPPKLIKKVDPEYPREAKEKGIEGVVIVEATTDKEGNVAKAVVINGEHEALNRAAIDAVRQWKYDVGLIEGKPMPMTFTVTLRFSLDEKEKEAELKKEVQKEEEPTHFDKPPKVIKKVDPEYPKEAKEKGIEGVVIVEATTDIHGNVKSVKVVEGAHDILNKAAVDAVKQWKYETVVIGGKPVGVEFVVTLKFKLKDKDKKKDKE